MPTMVNKQATGIIHSVLCLFLSVPVAPIKFLQKLKRQKRSKRQHLSISLSLSLSLSLWVQSCKNKPNAAFNHFYLREDVKRLRSKIRKWRNYGKKKNSHLLPQNVCGREAKHIVGYYEACESSRGLGSRKPDDFRMESSVCLKYWWINLRYQHPLAKEVVVCCGDLIVLKGLFK